MKTLKQILKETNVSSGIGVRGFGDVSGTPKVGDENESNPHIDRVVSGAEENNQLVKAFIANHTDGVYSFDDPNWWENAKGIIQRKMANIRSKSKQLKEEIGGAVIGGGTVAGTGSIAGLGVTPAGKPSNWGEPGVSPKKQAKHKVLTRAKPNEVGSAIKEVPLGEVKTGMFAGDKTFIVPESIYERAMLAKKDYQHWRTFINNEEFHPAIREFANSNPNSPIIFENEKTGYMCYARYGKKKRR